MARTGPRPARHNVSISPVNGEENAAGSAASATEPLLSDARPDSPLLDDEEPLIHDVSRQPLIPRSGRTNRFSRYYRQMSRERMLRATCIALAIALFVSLLLFYLGDGFHGPHGKKDQCETPTCLVTASNLLQSMNTSADPCEDFYHYACGGWDKAHRIPEDKMRVGAFDKLSEANQEFILSILEAPQPYLNPKVHMSAADSVLFGNLSAIFQSCANLTAINALGAKPLIYANDEMGKILPDDGNFTAALPLALVQIHKLGASPFIRASVQSDLVNPDSQILVLSPGGLGLPGKEYYKRGEIVDVYTRTLEKIFEFALPKKSNNLFQYSDEIGWDRFALAIVEFEKRLAEASPSSEEESDIKKNYNVESLATIKIKYPNFAWEDFFHHLFKESGVKPQSKYLDFIVVTWPPYFKVLNDILGRGGSNDVIGYYLRSVAMKSTIPYSSQAANELLQELRSVVYGVKSSPPRSKECLKHTDGMMGFATGRIYAVHKFSEESKTSASKIIRQILGEFMKKLDTVAWLEPSVRDSAKAKVIDMTLKIGYPEMVGKPELLAAYYGSMTASKDDFFNNHLVSTTTELRRMLLKLESPTDHSEFVMFPHVVNAYYEPTKNEIVFPAGILQAPFFDAELPDSMNYGGLGVVVGHELSHAFDVSGRQFDSKGRLVDWWTNKTAAEFETHAKCFIDQYNGFSLAAPNGTQIHVNGKLTVGENMADNSGILQSWAAWKTQRWGERKTLPGMKNMSDEKIFFLAFAQVWCGKSRPEYALQLVETDPHSPNFARVEGTCKNTPEFRDAFGCAAGKPMAPAKTCVLW